MNWDDLKFFLAVYRARSSAAAARNLGVQHTTVGRRLAALEESLGTHLFIRTSAGFEATEAAVAIAAAAEDVERGALSIARIAEAGELRVEGKVRVTTSEAFAGYLFGRLQRLRDAYPRLRVEILAGNRVFDIQHGEADIAVRMVPTQQPNLIGRRLVEASWSLYASQGYIAAAGRPASPFDLAGHQVVGFDASMAGSPGARWLATHAADATVSLVANSVGSVVQAADSGSGIAMMPCFLAAGRQNLVRLFDEVSEYRDIWLVFRKDVGQIARVRAVINFLAETVTGDAALFRGRPAAPP